VTVTPGPTPTPAWSTYTDPVLGFTLEYPADLSYTDSGEPATSAEWRERDIVFSSSKDSGHPVFAIAIVENHESLALDEWVAQFSACRPDTTVQGQVDGQPAIFCTSEPLRPELAVTFEFMGRMLLLRGPLSQPEFDRLVASIQL
jgi:hypothetical protein